MHTTDELQNMMESFVFHPTDNLWEHLLDTNKPIVMYGMGDGAVKILNVMNELGIKPAEFMASDEFVRGHSFMGYQVKKLSEIESMYSDFIIIVCFGTMIPEVMERIYGLSEKYEVYAPDVPVIGGGLFTTDYYDAHLDEIEEVRGLFEDEISKYVFDKWIDYRLSGRIGDLRDIETPKAEGYSLLKPTEKEIYVDLGAYNGDTVEEFLGQTGGKFNRIFAVEPDPRNYAKLRRRHYALSPSVFEPINAVAWDKDEKVPFSKRAGRNSAVGNGSRTEMAEGRSLDSILGGNPATLIKLDVEGCEKKALLGAEQTIRRYKPKLIVSLYHRTEDMIELPLLVHKLNSGYSLYLRHHPYIPAWDMNMYCV